ncbi:PLP-dependent aminotransferase family protein [Hymenobacter sp. BT730]|uniref:aminotransferase-like domain-containing protein n=1 Tax=Hymenobacter sp. BT730 TaxID=3063332 RepID=UPI0026E0F3D2|nr:PLP-dependent aminotransferase family protein [Hymenobacter sp. BT730]
MKSDAVGPPAHKYLVVAAQLEQQIQQGLLQTGQKLPSVRTLSQEMKLSISTILQAYYALESRGLVEAQPQSGYYVRGEHRASALPGRPAPHRVPAVPREEDVDSLLAQVFEQVATPDRLLFSQGGPSPALLPITKLNKALLQAQRELPHAGTSYEPLQGNLLLRRQIARYALFWGSTLTHEDLVTTEGCTSALAFCLTAVTKPGDTIAVESPVYFGVLQLALSLGLQLLELPTDPVTGVDLVALAQHLEQGQVQACLFTPNFSNPIGCCMPDEHKQQLVHLLEHYQVPLIEDDLFGDLHFGAHRPKPCKAYDRQGWVLWCSSVSKTLAPGYRVGWVAPGHYLEAVLRLKKCRAGRSPALTQQAVGNFLATGRYELHLRRLRQTLALNCARYQQTILASFPPDTKVSQPLGGFLLWVELNREIDTTQFYHALLDHQIVIAPGRLFSIQPQYTHCLRLSYGLPFDERVEQSLQLMGRLLKDRMPEPELYPEATLVIEA